MRTIRAWCAVAVAVIGATAQAGQLAASGPATRPATQPVITLVDDAPQVFEDESVALEVRILNPLDQAIFFLGHDFAEPHRLIDLAAKLHPPGREANPLWRNEELRKVHHVRLDPGQEMGQRLTFGPWRKTMPAGVWRLEAELDWSFGGPPDDSAFRWHWRRTPFRADVHIAKPTTRPLPRGWLQPRDPADRR